MLNLLNIFKAQKIEYYSTHNGKVVLVKEWPSKEDKNVSWGRLGFDSLYK